MARAVGFLYVNQAFEFSIICHDSRETLTKNSRNWVICFLSITTVAFHGRRDEFDAPLLLRAKLINYILIAPFIIPFWALLFFILIADRG